MEYSIRIGRAGGGSERIPAVVSQPDSKKRGGEGGIIERAKEAISQPEVARALLVHIKTSLSPGDIRPERGQSSQPALALTLATKAEPLPLGGGRLQQILALDGPRVGNAEGLRVAPG